jgi:hypothetical protein
MRSNLLLFLQPCTKRSDFLIGTIKPDDFHNFLGGGRKIQVEVANERPDRSDDPALELPMTVDHLDTQASCRLDGGIWDKDAKLLEDAENDGGETEIIAGDFNTGKGLAVIEGRYDSRQSYTDWTPPANVESYEPPPEGEWPLQTINFTQAGVPRIYFSRKATNKATAKSASPRSAFWL